jgi:sugar phosphate isomerase/epimerase
MMKPGDVAICRDLDSRPHMLVLATEVSILWTVSLARSASNAVQRLRRGHTDTVVETVGEAEDIDTYRVPTDDVGCDSADYLKQTCDFKYMKTGMQFFAIRNVDRPLTEIISDVGETSLDGVEFAFRVHETDKVTVREALDDAGLEVPASHVELETLEDDIDGAIEDAQTLGYNDIVVPWGEPEFFQSVDSTEEFANRLSEIANELAEAGITLHYHNHDQSFVETEEGLAYHVLADRAPDVMLQVDVGWALAGGVDPVDLLERYADRISMVHMKDVYTDSEDVPELGEGDLDIDAVGDAAHDINAEWLIYDNDEPRDPPTSHQLAADVLSEHS